MAVLSSAAFLSAVTPSFLNGPVSVLAASSGWTEENGTFRYYDSDGYYCLLYTSDAADEL